MRPPLDTFGRWRRTDARATASHGVKGAGLLIVDYGPCLILQLLYGLPFIFHLNLKTSYRDSILIFLHKIYYRLIIIIIHLRVVSLK